MITIMNIGYTFIINDHHLNHDKLMITIIKVKITMMIITIILINDDDNSDDKK